MPYLVQTQSVVDKISESEQKRLNLCSDKVLRSLAEIATEDAAGASDSDDSIMTLRAAISRLVDAGKRSGLSGTETADFQQLLTEDKLAHEIPTALQDTTGKLDIQGLFEGVAGRSAFGTSGREVNPDYLTLLDAAGAKLAPLDGSAGSAETSAQSEEADRENLSISIPASADGEAREILQRVEFRNGRWAIEVAADDTLAVYARVLYGDPLDYRLIYRANNTVLTNPNDLTIGLVLTLPKHK